MEERTVPEIVCRVMLRMAADSFGDWGVEMNVSKYSCARHVRLRNLLLATTALVLAWPVETMAQSRQNETLPTITVEGQRQRTSSRPTQAPAQTQPIAPQETAPTATTEGRDSYTTTLTTIGKDAQPIRYLPQSVSIVTRQRIEDQNMTTLEDAARRTTGLLVLQNDKGRSAIFSRGFEFDSFNIDGLPAPMSSIYGTQPELAAFDRIEVLRGPAGLFAGTGEPAGTLNMARKRATDRFGITGTALGGSWDAYRGEIDVNAPLTQSGNVRARVVGAYNDQDTFIDITKNKNGVTYGTVEIDFTPNTTLSLVALHQERDIIPQNGLPAFVNGGLLDVRRSTFSGAAWNRFDNRTDDFIAELQHKFDSGGHAKAAVRYSSRQADMKYAYGGGAVNPATGIYNITTLERHYNETSLSADAHISKPFEMWGLTHNVIIGVDHKQYDQTLLGGTFAQGTNNIYSPTPYNIAEPSVPLSRTQDRPELTGIYGQLRIKPIQPLTVILGGRGSWYDNSSILANGQTVSSEVNGKFTPYAGIVLDLTQNISAYGVYTDIFQPQPTNRTASGAVLPPRTGTTYEVGLKGEFLNGQLNASIGYFITRDTNRAITDPSNTAFQIAAGEAELRGIEAEVTGKLAPGWEIYAGYAYTESEYLKTVTASGSTFLAGSTFSTWTPKHNFSMWTKYEFQSEQLRGWHVAGGVRALSSFYTRNATDTVRWTEDGYVVADAQIGYKFNKNFEATFTVNNLFDEVYYARLGNQATFNFYGEPRSYWVKLTAKN